MEETTASYHVRTASSESCQGDTYPAQQKESHYKYMEDKRAKSPRLFPDITIHEFEKFSPRGCKD